MISKSSNLIVNFRNLFAKNLLASALFLMPLGLNLNKSWAQVESLYNSSTDQFAGISNLMSAVANNDIEGVAFFSKSGPIIINQRNKGGATALHIACREGNFDIAKILIDNGANVDIKDNEGWTPLMRASIANNPQIVEYLLSKGAKASATNIKNETALIHATIARCAECINQIIEKGNLAKEMNTLLLKNQIADAFLIARNQENKQNQTTLESFLDYVSNVSPVLANDDSSNDELQVIPALGKKSKNKFSKNYVLKGAEDNISNRDDDVYSVLEDPSASSASTFKNTDLAPISETKNSKAKNNPKATNIKPEVEVAQIDNAKNNASDDALGVDNIAPSTKTAQANKIAPANKIDPTNMAKIGPKYKLKKAGAGRNNSDEMAESLQKDGASLGKKAKNFKFKSGKAPEIVNKTRGANSDQNASMADSAQNFSGDFSNDSSGQNSSNQDNSGAEAVEEISLNESSDAQNKAKQDNQPSFFSKISNFFTKDNLQKFVPKFPANNAENEDENNSENIDEDSSQSSSQPKKYKLVKTQ